MKNVTETPQVQELDAFRMKAITMLTAHGFRYQMISQQVRNEPIQAIFDSSIVSLTQELTFSPGIKVKVRGSFNREGAKTKYSVPIRDSFTIELSRSS